MKRNKFFCVPTAVVILVTLILAVDSANAQSKDRDNPTQLTSNEISGLINEDNLGDHYYYTFVAGPGEITLTLSVQSGNGKSNQVSFDLSNDNARQLGYGTMGAYGGRTEQLVKRIDVNRRQPVLLHITINDWSQGSGRYRLRVGGAVDVSQNKQSAGGGDSVTRIEPINEAKANARRDALRQTMCVNECLPKQGTLIVTLKDGSTIKIDLSQVEKGGIQIRP